MEQDPALSCVTALQQAGWHVAPAANPWHVITEIHADRWWSPQVVDTAVLSISAGQGLLQRLQLQPPAHGSGLPEHWILASTEMQPFEELAMLLPSWSIPPGEVPAGEQDSREPPSQ